MELTFKGFSKTISKQKFLQNQKPVNIDTKNAQDTKLCLKLDATGNIIDALGNVIKSGAGLKLDAHGSICDAHGKVIGAGSSLQLDAHGNVCDAHGRVIWKGAGLKLDAHGKICDTNGKVLGGGGFLKPFIFFRLMLLFIFDGIRKLSLPNFFS